MDSLDRAKTVISRLGDRGVNVVIRVIARVLRVVAKLARVGRLSRITGILATVGKPRKFVVKIVGIAGLKVGGHG